MVHPMLSRLPRCPAGRRIRCRRSRPSERARRDKRPGQRQREHAGRGTFVREEIHHISRRQHGRALRPNRRSRSASTRARRAGVKWERPGCVRANPEECDQRPSAHAARNPHPGGQSGRPPCARARRRRRSASHEALSTSRKAHRLGTRRRAGGSRSRAGDEGGSAPSRDAAVDGTCGPARKAAARTRQRHGTPCGKRPRALSETERNPLPSGLRRTCGDAQESDHAPPGKLWFEGRVQMRWPLGSSVCRGRTRASRNSDGPVTSTSSRRRATGEARPVGDRETRENSRSSSVLAARYTAQHVGRAAIRCSAS
jgi:hypothetical protein